MASGITIRRLRDGDPEQGLACQAIDKTNCGRGDVAIYRVEKANPATGEVWRRVFCLNATAAWAARFHVPFPPGPVATTAEATAP